jgi:Flp pilus assembly pilin Flp
MAATGKKHHSSNLISRLRDLVEDEEGQGIVEYSLIILLSSVAVVSALGLFGSSLADRFDTIANVVTSL